MSETTNVCRCGRPTRDNAFVCEDCGDSLARALGDVPWLTQQLEISVTGQKGVDYRRVGGSKGGQKATERPSPVSWGPSEARAHLRSLLVSWVLYSASEGVRSRGVDNELPDDTLIAMSRWMLNRVDGLLLDDIGSDAVDEITSAVAHCHRLIDRPADRMYAGRCGAKVGDDQPDCQTDLYAAVGARHIVCPQCGTTWDVTARRQWLLTEAEEVLATAVEISRAVSWLGASPLTADRVRQWGSRKRLVVRGHDQNGNPLYRVGDAIDLLAATAPKDGAA